MLLRSLLVTALACTALAGCHGGDKKGKIPTGQVAATLNGKEITTMDLNAELADAPQMPPEARKAAEQAALQQIISRKILVASAETQGLDKTPNYEIQKKRAVDNMLVGLLQRKIASSVPAPTDAEGEAFVKDHPNLFADRKIFIVDQIRAVRPPRALDPKAFAPLTSLEQVEQYLTSQNIQFQRNADAVDALTTNPAVVDNILKLPANEIFIVPAGNALIFNQIIQTRSAPFSGPTATKYAVEMLKAQRTQEAVGRQLQATVKQSANAVQYNAAFKPPPPKPAAPPAEQSPQAPGAKGNGV